MSRKSCPDNAAGFTLIEALVALAIVAAMLSSIAAVVMTTVKAIRGTDQRLALSGAAGTLLAALPPRDLLKPGVQVGQLAGHRWRLDARPLGAAATNPAARWSPMSVTLSLAAPGGPALTINTVRLVRTAAP